MQLFYYYFIFLQKLDETLKDNASHRIEMLTKSLLLVLVLIIPTITISITSILFDTAVFAQEENKDPKQKK